MVMEEEALTGQILGCAMKVHSVLGPGFLESVYRKALHHELMRAGFRVATEVPIAVHYDGLVAGQFSADLLVEDRVLLELNANLALALANDVELVN